MSEAPMHIARPTIKNEFNVTTAIALFGVFAMGAGWLWTMSEWKAKVTTWQENHDELHKARIVYTTTVEQRVDQRLKVLEDRDNEDRVKMERMEYRLTLQEGQFANFTKAFDELKSTVNDLRGDIKVILEISKRTDAKNGRQ